MGVQRFMFNDGMHCPRSIERLEMVFGGSCGVKRVIKLTDSIHMKIGLASTLHT